MNVSEDNYLSKINNISEEFNTTNIDIKDDEPPIEFLLAGYKDAIFSSVITSFGLDMILFNDRRGGEVDTINTAGDKSVEGFASAKNQADYDNRGAYDSSSYHRHENYINQNKETSKAQKSGNLIDGYSGKRMSPNKTGDLDHIVAAKTTHDDQRRTLAGVSGEDATNIEENLLKTDRSVNRSKKQTEPDVYANYLDDTRHERNKEIDKLLKKKKEGNFTDRDRKELNKLEQLEAVDTDLMRKEAKKVKDAQTSLYERKYYGSKKFHSATTIAAAKSGIKMGVREATGLILLDTFTVVEEEMPSVVEELKDDFTLERFLSEMKDLLISAYNRVHERWKGYIMAFKDGILAGALASLTSTGINMFETTFATAGRILRQSWSSIIQAVKILVFNPDQLPYGEVLRSVFKIIATTASVMAGVLLQETLSKPALALPPSLQRVVPAFVGSLLSGVLSVSFLYFFDYSKKVQQIVNYANQIKDEFDVKLDYYTQATDRLTKVVAQLEQIDFDTLEKEASQISDLFEELEKAENLNEENTILRNHLKVMGIEMPYNTKEERDDFMTDKSSVLKI